MMKSVLNTMNFAQPREGPGRAPPGTSGNARTTCSLLLAAFHHPTCVNLLALIRKFLRQVAYAFQEGESCVNWDHPKL